MCPATLLTKSETLAKALLCRTAAGGHGGKSRLEKGPNTFNKQYSNARNSSVNVKTFYIAKLCVFLGPQFKGKGDLSSSCSLV